MPNISYKSQIEQKVMGLKPGTDFYPKDIDPESPRSAGMILSRFYQSLGVTKRFNNHVWVYHKP